MNSHDSFDPPEEPSYPEDDEFMRFYRQSRSGGGFVPSAHGLHRTGSTNSDSTRASSMSTSVARTGESSPTSFGGSGSGNQAAAAKKSSKWRLKDKLKNWYSMHGNRHHHHQRPRLTKARSTEYNSSSDSMTSPLGGLSGIINDKMTLRNYLQQQEEIIPSSRDSGNSSGGSPDLTAAGSRLRKRRLQQQQQQQSNPPPLPRRTYDPWRQQRSTTASPSQYDVPRRSHHQLQHQHHHPYDPDRQSVYSYETARDLIDPADLVFGPGGPRDLDEEQSNYDQSSFYDALSTSSNYFFHHQQQPTNNNRGPPRQYDLRHYHYQQQQQQQQQPAYGKRKLDCLREDVSTFTGSPCRKRSCTPDKIKLAPVKKTGHFFHHLSGLIKGQFLLKLTCLIALIASAIFWTYHNYHQCDPDRGSGFRMDAIRSTLDSKLFGQTKAKKQIILALEEFNSYSDSAAVSVLALVGWLGTGKTFAASLLRDSFPVRESIHSFSVPLHFSTSADLSKFDFLDALSLSIGRTCGRSLVIFDDVDLAQKEQTEPIERFIGRLRAGAPAGGPAGGGNASNGTLIVLTSTSGGNENEDDVFNVPSFFSAATSKTIAPFNPLNRADVQKCVEKEASDQGLNLGQDEVDRVLEDVEFLDSSDLARKGCKQIARKVDRLFGNN